MSLATVTYPFLKDEKKGVLGNHKALWPLPIYTKRLVGMNVGCASALALLLPSQLRQGFAMFFFIPLKY